MLFVDACCYSSSYTVFVDDVLAQRMTMLIYPPPPSPLFFFLVALSVLSTLNVYARSIYRSCLI